MVQSTGASNGANSVFYIDLKNCNHLNEKNVVFGEVLTLTLTLIGEVLNHLLYLEILIIFGEVLNHRMTMLNLICFWL